MADTLAQDIARFFARDHGAFDAAYRAWLAGDQDPEWDESKVKRDDEGKFSEQAAAKPAKAARPAKAAKPAAAARPRQPPRGKGPMAAFISPNTGELTFAGARSELRSKRQALLGEVSGAINARLGLKADTANVIGAWADGAENTLMVRTKGQNVDLAKAATIIKGAITRQKQVLFFQPGVGEHAMITMPMQGELNAIHEQLLQAGIAFHTLEPSAEGANIHVFSMEQATTDLVSAFAKEHGLKPSYVQGDGAFIPPEYKGDTDAAEREDAQRGYAQALDDISRRLGRQDLRGIWDDAQHHWDAATTDPDKQVGLVGSQGHPALIASRRVTGAGALESDRYRAPNVDAMAADAEVFRYNTGLLTDASLYPNFRAEDVAGKTPQEIARVAVDQFKSNLKALYRHASPELRAAAHKWYEGANALAAKAAKAHNLPLASSVGVFAALSPQKDWDENVYLAQQLIEIHQTKREFRWDDEMAAKAAVIWAPKPLSKRDIAAGKVKSKQTLANEAATAKLIAKIRGKQLGELSDPFEQAAWIRTYNEAKTDRTYQHYSPDGHPTGLARGKTGKPIAASWQQTPAVAKAIVALESGGDRNLLSSIMGDMHKVRSFYNNILDPSSPNGDVTADTHAVGAALLRGVTSNTAQVAQAWGASLDKKYQPPGYKAAHGSDVTGMQGLYGIYADAYREAAAELAEELSITLDPRSLQSAVWEEKRILFNDDVIGTQREDKTTPREDIEQAWRAFHVGQRDLAATQAEIFRIAKQARKDYDARQAELAKTSKPRARKAADAAPAAVGYAGQRSAGQMDAQQRHSGHARDLHPSGLWPGRTGYADAGTGNAVAQGIAPDLDRDIARFFGQDAAFRESDVKRDDEGKFATQAGGGVTPKETRKKLSVAEVKRQAANLPEMADADLDEAMSFLWWERQSKTQEGVWKTKADGLLYARLNAERTKRRAKTAMGPERVMHYTKARVRVDKILHGPDKVENRDAAFGKIADAVAEAMDYPQRDRIKFSPAEHKFTLGGKERYAAGVAYGGSGERRGDIEIYTNHTTLGSTAPVLTHEIMHQKYNAILDRLGEETRGIRELERGEGNINRVRYADDSLRPEYQEQFPLYHRMNPRGLGHSLLTEPRLDDEDGITDYSREWWEEVKAGKANRYTAINETLAEMAMLEWDGQLPRLSWYKDSTAYRPLYEAMREFSKGRKVGATSTADAALDAAIRAFLKAA